MHMLNWYSKSKVIEAVVSPETAKKLKFEHDLPKDEVFSRAVQNTQNARITEHGLEIEVTRNQHPDQGERNSLRSGVFYQPTGSPSRYPYSGKHGYGGIEKIKGLTLLRRPLFVRGATGGRAPQMAYDAIKGQGAYEKMREDVLRIVSKNSYNTNSAQAYEDIYLFLKKYEGDVNLTGAIDKFRRTAVSNNFAYALQENIVASAVRNAGYDSVVGWSLRKDGSPFISEIFDVREKTYPSKYKSEGEIHDQLR